MSGQPQLADLLKKLSDNTIAIAEQANRAREIGAKPGADGGGPAADPAEPAGGEPRTGPAAPPSQDGAGASAPPAQTPEQREAQNVANQADKAAMASSISRRKTPPRLGSRQARFDQQAHHVAGRIHIGMAGRNDSAAHESQILLCAFVRWLQSRGFTGSVGDHRPGGIVGDRG